MGHGGIVAERAFEISKRRHLNLVILWRIKSAISPVPDVGDTAAFIPSSLGITVSLAKEATYLTAEVSYGRYTRFKDETKERTYWQRIAQMSDMSGYAVAYVSATYGVPCFIIKAIAGYLFGQDENFQRSLERAHESIGDFLMRHATA